MAQLGSPLWALAGLTPPPPDMMQQPAGGFSFRPPSPGRGQDASPLPPTHHLSWQRNNFQQVWQRTTPLQAT